MSAGGSSSGRRRATTKTYQAEDQALNQIAREAEQRLAARRAARAEARDIRMRELEKQQKEAEEKQDRHFELMTEHRNTMRTYPTLSNSRSEDSDDARELRKELAVLEEKYKKAMMNNAQLDNEKQTYRYQADLLKDQMEELEEQLIEITREHKDRCRDLEFQKRTSKDLQRETEFLKVQLIQRDKLIEEHGLVFVNDDSVKQKEKAQVNGAGEDDGASLTAGETQTSALLTPQALAILHTTDGSSLDERLKMFAEEREQLQEEIKRLKQTVEEEKEKNALAEKYSSPKSDATVNGPDMQVLEVQKDTKSKGKKGKKEVPPMEHQRQLSDYKFKLKKAEQDITTLEGNVIRLESQVKRYRAAAENSEKQEEELKQEKRKLQRELREAQVQMEELATQNNHLQKRLDKFKAARNAMVK